MDNNLAVTKCKDMYVTLYPNERSKFETPSAGLRSKKSSGNYGFTSLDVLVSSVGIVSRAPSTLNIVTVTFKLLRFFHKSSLFAQLHLFHNDRRCPNHNLVHHLYQ